MVIYRRKLPHIQPLDGCFFVTFMLKGALPRPKIQTLESLRKAIAEKDQKTLDTLPFPNNRQVPWERYIAAFSDLLENPTSAPLWLEQEKVADEIVNSLQYLSTSEMRVLAWCIMPNHVHLLIDELQAPLNSILQRLKRHTAVKCNRILDRTGQAFWQDESFDYLLRKEDKVLEKAIYILQNPVRAGLVGHRSDWKYSGTHPIMEMTIKELGI